MSAAPYLGGLVGSYSADFLGRKRSGAALFWKEPRTKPEAVEKPMRMKQTRIG